MAKQESKPRIFVWQGNWQGGAERIAQSMANFLKEQGENITIGVYKENTQSTLPQIVFPAPKIIPSSFRSLFASIIWRFRYAHKFNAVYSHTLGAWNNKGCTVFIHEAADLDNYLQTPKLIHGYAARIWKYLYLILSLRPAQAIFCATQETQNFMLRHGIKKSRLFKSSSFYNEDIFKTCPIIRINKPARLLFIGNHADPRKRFHLIVKAFGNKPDYQISVAGGEKISTQKNITYHGYCSPEDIYHLLCQSHVFILPSQSEGFSIAILEALATGIPCVASRSAVHKEILNTPNLLTFDTPEHLVDTVKYAITNYIDIKKTNPNLSQYTRSAVLDREYSTMKNILSSL